MLTTRLHPKDHQVQFQVVATATVGLGGVEAGGGDVVTLRWRSDQHLWHQILTGPRLRRTKRRRLREQRQMRTKSEEAKVEVGEERRSEQ